MPLHRDREEAQGTLRVPQTLAGPVPSRRSTGISLGQAPHVFFFVSLDLLTRIHTAGVS